tara:strand:- start:1412 stop:2515 length:1104 start_codon:yes stop_codon:yes gene_type:complete
MKILHVYKSYFPDSFGGVEKVIESIVKQSNKNGFKTDVLSFSKKSGEHEFDNYKNIKLKYNIIISSTPFSIQAIFEFKKIISKYDLIHFHYPFPFADVLKILFCPFKKSIVTYHSDIVHQKIMKLVYYPVEKTFLSLINQIVYTSPNYLKTSDNLYKYKHKITCIPIGININKLSKISDKYIEKWEKKFKYPTFIFIGVPRKYKGINVLIKAAQGLKCNILIIGSGNKMAEFEENSKKLKNKNIIFVNNINDDEKRVLLKLCYGLILPSTHKSEAFGIVLVEAAVNGKPLISCEIGTGTSFVNLNGKTGFVLPPNNPVRLREAISYLLHHPKLAAKMGQSAKLRANSLFHEKDMALSYFDLYKKVMN